METAVIRQWAEWATLQKTGQPNFEFAQIFCKLSMRVISVLV